MVKSFVCLPSTHLHTVQYTELHAQGGWARDPWGHQEGLQGVGERHSAPFPGDSLQLHTRQGGGVCRHHDLLCGGFSRWQQPVRWWGGLPGTRLLSWQWHRWRHPLRCVWALDYWKPRPAWWDSVETPNLQLTRHFIASETFCLNVGSCCMFRVWAKTWDKFKLVSECAYFLKCSNHRHVHCQLFESNTSPHDLRPILVFTHWCAFESLWKFPVLYFLSHQHKHCTHYIHN